MIQNSESLYQRLQDLISGKIGLKINDRKLDELEQTLLRGFAGSQYSSLQEYMTWLTKIPISSPDWRRLIEILTINETYFFRNAPQMEALRSEIFPWLIDNKRRQNRKELRIWSAGCATGEEPYSLAILLSEILPDFKKWNIFILGTDINHASLEKARKGFYREWSFRDVPQRIKAEYFTAQDGGFVIRPDIRNMVTYSYLNLVENCYPSFYNQTTEIDMIICRNVVIYFSNKTTEQIMDGFFQTLDKDGWLVVGHSEPMTTIRHDFQPVNIQNALFYRKPQSNPAEITTKIKSGSVQKKHFTQNPFLKNSHILMRRGKPIRTIRSTPYRKVGKKVARQDLNFKSEMQSLINSGRWKQAIEEILYKIKEKPDVVDLYLDIAKIYADQKMLDDALHWCNKALKLDRTYLPSYFMVSLIYQELNRLDDAEKLLKQAIYVNPDFLYGHFHLAMIYQKSGDLKKAEKTFTNLKRELADLSASDKLIYSDGMSVDQMSNLVATYLQKLNRTH